MKKIATAAGAALSATALALVAVSAHTAVAASVPVAQNPDADADVQLNLATEDSQVQPGEEFLVSGLVTNTTNHTLTNLHIDLAMSQAEAVAGQIAPREGTISNTSAHGKVVWNVPSLKPGQRFGVDVKFKVLPSAPVGGIVPVNLTVISGNDKNPVASQTELVQVIKPQQ
ncbi:hypothetical protein [Streptomyces sp. NPDC001635]|nr:hypothetical protein E4K10_47160 [Streptomyces sp. T1317-0309]